MRLTILILAGGLACGRAVPGSTGSSEAEGREDPISAMLIAAEETEPESDSPLEIPSDFAIVVTAGPVAVDFEGGRRPIRIEARPDGSGDFDLVVMETSVEIGSRGRGPDPVFRAPLEAADVRPIYAIFRDRRAELEAPCIDHSVQDGGWRAIRVRADGAEHRFQCTNASTPAFDELADAFDALVQNHVPPE